MKLSQIKKHLRTAGTVSFKLASGNYVPEHFHVTEVGLVTKHFIDCGGTERFEQVANFQLLDANDVEHRLKPSKLLRIIELCERVLGMDDLEIEVEYQTTTVGKYALHLDGKDFVLEPKQTACLASDHCGVSASKQKVEVNELQTQTACCTPGHGCC